MSNADEDGTSLNEIVNELLDKKPEVRAAFDAMCARGVPLNAARMELGRAFVGCISERCFGVPDRWVEIFSALEQGRATQELFDRRMYAVLANMDHDAPDWDEGEDD